jgi:hypothetical protein
MLDDTAGAFRRGTFERCRLAPNRPAVIVAPPATDNPVGSNTQKLAAYTSRVVSTEFPFNEIVPSWNVEVPNGAGFYVEIRFGRGADSFWTAWYYFGRWGAAGESLEKHIRDEHGVVRVDCFQSSETFDRLQYRVHFHSALANVGPALRRFAIAYSNVLDDAELARKHPPAFEVGPKSQWARRLPVPFKSQKDAPPDLRSLVCSPTATAMVMAYYGVDRAPGDVARVIYDPEYEIYGTWLRAVEGAFTCGVPGYIERFGDWDAVKRQIAAGHPVVASIVAGRDELRGARYHATDGHLIVIAGFDGRGGVHVNDPAGTTRDEGVVTYAMDDLETVWFGHGGVGYVLLPPERPIATQPARAGVRTAR